MDEVTKECKRLHNEELYALCALPNIVRVIKSLRMRRAGHVARTRMRGAYRVFVRKAERRRQLVRLRRRREVNIKMGLKEVGRGHGLD